MTFHVAVSEIVCNERILISRWATAQLAMTELVQRAVPCNRQVWCKTEQIKCQGDWRRGGLSAA